VHRDKREKLPIVFEYHKIKLPQKPIGGKGVDDVDFAGDNRRVLQGNSHLPCGLEAETVGPDEILISILAFEKVRLGPKDVPLRNPGKVGKGPKPISFCRFPSNRKGEGVVETKKRQPHKTKTLLVFPFHRFIELERVPDNLPVLQHLLPGSPGVLRVKVDFTGKECRVENGGCSPSIIRRSTERFVWRRKSSAMISARM
jgi:hypothetical protein